MPAPVRIGLAGYGLGGRYFHAPLLASAANCDLLGVVTSSPEHRRQVAEDLARPAFACMEELAGAGAEAVAISTSAATHVTLTQQALRLGLAVACDKPFALDADSARGTRPVPVDPWDAVATAAVLDAARTSARTAQVVSPARTA